MSNITIKIHDEELEITSDLIAYYKQITRKKRATKKALQKFLKTLVNKLQSYD